MAFPRVQIHGVGALAAISHGVVANVLIAVFNIVAGIVSARYLGATGRGELAALVTLPTFFSFVMTFGLPSGLIYHVRRSSGLVADLAAAAMVWSLIAGTAGAVIAFFVTPYVLTELTPALLPVAQGLVIFTILGVMSQVTMALLQAQHQFLAYNYIRFAQPVLQVAGMVVLAACGWMTPLTAALVVLLAGLPGLLWTIKSIVVAHRPNWARWLISAKTMSSYSMRAFGGELLSGMAGQLDKVIVVGIFSPAMMGMYVVALSLSRILAMFPGAVVSVLFPKASGLSDIDVIRITSKAAGGTALLVGLSMIGLIVFGPILLRFVYGAEFEAAAFAFRLLVVEAAIASIVQVLSQALLALNRPGLVTLQYGSGLIVAVPMLLLLAPTWGVEGAAAALLAASVVRLVCTYWCFTGIMKIAAPNVLREVGPSLAAFTAAMRAALR